jgi:hypothetical protein
MNKILADLDQVVGITQLTDEPDPEHIGWYSVDYLSDMMKLLRFLKVENVDVGRIIKPDGFAVLTMRPIGRTVGERVHICIAPRTEE